MSAKLFNKSAGSKIPEYKLAFIRVNCEKMTAQEIADELDLSKTTVYQYCIRMGLTLKKRRTIEPDNETEIAKRRGVIRFFKPDPQQKPIERPAAKYQNMSSEDKINYYLSL